MLNQPSQEQIKKLWMYFGFKQDGVGIWHCPNKIDERRSMPITLDNLFKYAIPKLQDKGHIILIQCYEHKGFSVLITDVIHKYSATLKFEGNDLSLALFWAVWEIVKNG